MKNEKKEWRVDVFYDGRTTQTTHSIVSCSGTDIGKAPIAQLFNFNPYPVPTHIKSENAFLMASAPKLLRACIAMRNWIEWKHSEDANKDLNIEEINLLITELTEDETA